MSEHEFFGPENIDNWLKHVENVVSDAKNGRSYEVEYKLKKDVKPDCLVKVERFLGTDEVGRTYKAWRAFYKSKPAKSKEQFLEMCRYRLMISDESTFLKVYF